MVQGLNSLEKSKVDNGKVTYPNEYAIEFEKGTAIGDARLVPKDYYVKERAPFNSIQNADPRKQYSVAVDHMKELTVHHILAIQI